MPRFSSIVVDHFSNPRNLGRISQPDAQAFVGNPVCGDQILLSAVFEGDIVSNIKFEARGCAAALATGSLLTELLAGKNVDQCAAITANDLTNSLGGLNPEQAHVVKLGLDVIERFVRSKQLGKLDQVPENGACGG